MMEKFMNLKSRNPAIVLSHYMRSKPYATLAALAWVVAQLAYAEPIDKSQYTLFDPTPREHMRDLSADRPDATESPITVDAGHLQIETSFVAYTHDDGNNETLDSWTFFDTNVKVGVLNDVDVQFVFSAYTEERTDPDGPGSETLEGFGDVQIRLKKNLWGNDPGPESNTAAGIMPFVKIPTGTSLSNGRLEGGIIAMFAWDVAETWGLGGQVEVGAVDDDAEGDYDVEISHTGVLGLDLVGALGAYIEYLGVASTEGDSNY